LLDVSPLLVAGALISRKSAGKRPMLVDPAQQLQLNDK
jgi:hypothetical protein